MNKGLCDAWDMGLKNCFFILILPLFTKGYCPIQKAKEKEAVYVCGNTKWVLVDSMTKKTEERMEERASKQEIILALTKGRHRHLLPIYGLK